MNEIRLILSDSLDRPLNSDETELLSSKLRDDADCLNQFVLNSFVHSQLIDWLGQERVRDAALVGDITRNGAAAELLAPGSVNGEIGKISHRPAAALSRHAKAKSSWHSAPWLAALAAMLLIAVTLSTVGYFAFSGPVYVGQLTEAGNCRWAASQGNIPMGTLLESGQELQLVAGRAVITFASGAQILLEGPVDLRLDSKDAAHLLAGRIATKVPTHAIGFAVTSPLAQFVDLGTAFTLKMDPQKSFELYVFEGMVEVQIDERFGEKVAQPLRVSEVGSLKFDVETNGISKLTFKGGEQMPF